MTLKVTSDMVTSLDASKLSGTLPALDGSSLTGITVGFADVTSSTDPLYTTNPAGGVGTIHMNTTTGQLYICTDATTDLNVWTNVGGGSGDVAPWVYQGESDGYTGGGSAGNDKMITKFSFASNTTATLHGEFLTQRKEGSSPGLSSPTEGFALNNGTTGIEKFAFAGSGVTASTHGDLATQLNASSASNNETHGYVTGGYVAPSQTNVINKFAFSSNTTADDHGDITLGKYAHTGQSSATHGYASGGNIINGSGTHVMQDTIYKFAFSSNITATDIGDLTTVRKGAAGQSSATHGYTSGGIDPNAFSTIIDKFSFSTDGNATDVGDLTVGRHYCAGCSSTTHGFTSNGNESGGYSNVIDKFSFSSDGNATDHGDGYHTETSIYESSHQV